MSNATMMRVVVRPDEITLVETSKPIPFASEILVETTVTGVCGSDTHAAAGHHPFVPLPYFPGHEVVGIVRELGPDVQGIAVGDHVTVEPTLPCWNCKMCLTGRSNLCENLRFFGELYGLSGSDLRRRVARTLARVHLTDRAGLDTLRTWDLDRMLADASTGGGTESVETGDASR